METPSDYGSPVYFNDIKYNENTDCFEAYLPYESDPRVEVPARLETIKSLISLLVEAATDPRTTKD